MTYHIKPTGEVGNCRAEYKCPYGNMSSHDEDRGKLRAVYETFITNLSDNDKTAEFYFSTSDEMTNFTMGDCAHLAKALAKKTGGILVVGSRDAIIDETQESDWDHMAVRIKDGRILDVDGLWTEKDFTEKWKIPKESGFLCEISEKNFKNFEPDGLYFDSSPVKTANKIVKQIKDFVQF